jgi:hypothetical protein
MHKWIQLAEKPWRLYKSSHSNMQIQPFIIKLEKSNEKSGQKTSKNPTIVKIKPKK